MMIVTRKRCKELSEKAKLTKMTTMIRVWMKRSSMINKTKMMRKWREKTRTIVPKMKKDRKKQRKVESNLLRAE